MDQEEYTNDVSLCNGRDYTIYDTKVTTSKSYNIEADFSLFTFDIYITGLKNCIPGVNKCKIMSKRMILEEFHIHEEVLYALRCEQDTTRWLRNNIYLSKYRVFCLFNIDKDDEIQCSNVIAEYVRFVEYKKIYHYMANKSFK